MPHVYRDMPRPPREVIEGYARTGAATVHEAAGQTGALAPGIQALAPGVRVCGPALTVLCRGRDNLMLHKALEVARPGDVLVVGTEHTPDAGYWGGILTVSAQARGVAGLVVDGCVRDTAEIRELGFPVFCRGRYVLGAAKARLGLINHPVVCGGVLVHPGDLVLGDDDGVVAVPRDRAAAVAERAAERDRKEAGVTERVRNGELTLHLSGLDATLADLGMEEA